MIKLYIYQKTALTLLSLGFIISYCLTFVVYVPVDVGSESCKTTWVKGAVSGIGLRSPALDFSLRFASRSLCVSPHLLLFLNAIVLLHISYRSCKVIGSCQQFRNLVNSGINIFPRNSEKIQKMWHRMST